jgi:uncharacterized membrane protein
MKSFAQSTWLAPAGLLLLGLLPLLGGALRLTELIAGAEITKDNARYFAAPLPIVLHVVSCSVYFVLGALQFSPVLRSKGSRWHRTAGRILIPAGLACAATGMWMAVVYPPVFGDGTSLTFVRLLVGSAIVLFIALGFAAVRRREFREHRAWMTRAYALAIAAGTQPLTLGVVYVVYGAFAEMQYTLGMTAGWLLNLAVAEWLIRRRRNPEVLPVRVEGSAV